MLYGKLIKRCWIRDTIVEHSIREIVVKMIPFQAVCRFIDADIKQSFDLVLMSDLGYERSCEIIVDDLLFIPQPAVHLILTEHCIRDVEIAICDAL